MTCNLLRLCSPHIGETADMATCAELPAVIDNAVSPKQDEHVQDTNPLFEQPQSNPQAFVSEHDDSLSDLPKNEDSQDSDFQLDQGDEIGDRTHNSVSQLSSDAGSDSDGDYADSRRRKRRHVADGRSRKKAKQYVQPDNEQTRKLRNREMESDQEKQDIKPQKELSRANSQADSCRTSEQGQEEGAYCCWCTCMLRHSLQYTNALSLLHVHYTTLAVVDIVATTTKCTTPFHLHSTVASHSVVASVMSHANILAIITLDMQCSSWRKADCVYDQQCSQRPVVCAH